MFKIGVIGPNASVNRIVSHTEYYEEQVKFLPFPYTEIYEIEEIVENHEFHIDAWLFSGVVPYEVAHANGKIKKETIYISVTDSAFYKAFLELNYQKGTIVKRMSVDIIRDKSDLNAGLQQANVDLDECFVKVFQPDFKPEELFHYHIDLWQKGKTEGVLTCLPSVCDQLRDAGVPAAWMTPTHMQIRETLKIITEKVKASYFKETQISVVIIEVEDFDALTANNNTPYRLQYLELKLREIIINLCEKVKGTVIEKGHGRYMIFNTRGEIERELPALRETVYHLALEASNKVAAGIGFGKTVYSAEENAYKAIRQSKESKSKKLIMIQDDGEAIELEEKNEELKYSVRTVDESLITKLKTVNVSVKTYNKLIAQIQRMGWTSFTAKDIALQMNMTERNARRIVMDLHEAELIKCIGEQSQSRGRPSKIYQLN
ncbi:hypothetical protein [Mesobacillus maritimus]|uniref:hypothetical protein n=1 Tax=Mesobacillus maritimus TaxID=1643336 RepID=UPI00384E29B3